MPDILLIQPPIRDFYLTKKRTIPYGLASIATPLIQQGFSVEILDGLATKKSGIIPLPSEMNYLREFYSRDDQSPFSLFYQYRHYGYSFEHIGVTAGRSGAFLVGISSLFTPYAEEALTVANIVKRYLPDCKVVLGGHHPTTMPAEVLKHDAVDFVIRGEGEFSMLLLAESLKNQDSLDAIPGLCYHSMTGTMVIKPPTLVENPNKFPLPALNLINHKFYQRKGKGSTVIMSGRGCPMKCSYCSVSAHSYLSFRRRPLSAVLEEIDIAIQSGARFIDFEDENLSIHRDWFLELLTTIETRYHGMDLELRAMNGLLPTTLDKTAVKAMARAGFKELNLALCTTSREQLKRFSRPDVRSAFERALGWAEQHQLKAVGYIIIGAPWQTPDESLDDLLYLADKKVLAGLSVYYPSPGSSDFETYHSQGLLPASNTLSRSTALPISHSTTRLETVTLLRLGRILNFMKSLPNPMERGVSGETNDMGRQLLARFWEDGKIRGIDSQGEIYQQNISPTLTTRFLKKLKQIEIKSLQ